MKYYPSQSKLKRANEAVNNYDLLMSQRPSLSDLRLVEKGRAEKLEKDALVEYVYNGLGGAPALEGAKAEEAKKKADEAVKRSKKRTGRAFENSKVIVK